MLQQPQMDAVSRAPTPARSSSNESHSSRLLAATAAGAVFTAMSCAMRWAAGNLAGVERPAAQSQPHRLVSVESESGQQDLGGFGDARPPRQDCQILAHAVAEGVALADSG